MTRRGTSAVPKREGDHEQRAVRDGDGGQGMLEYALLLLLVFLATATAMGGLGTALVPLLQDAVDAFP